MPAPYGTECGGKFKGRDVPCAESIGVLVALLLGSAAAGPQARRRPTPTGRSVSSCRSARAGFADITMRLVGQKLSERLGQQVVIENRPSAGGIVAANAVTAAPPDGYTLFVLSSGIALSKSLLKTMPFDPVTAFAPISTRGAVRPAAAGEGRLAAADAQDMLDAARANPAQFNIGTINPGSTQNVTAELLRSATGIPMTIVPHRTSAEVLTSLLARRHPDRRRVLCRAEIADRRRADPRHRRSRRKRSPMQPNVPTLRESGVDAAVDGWNSLVAPAGTPKEIVARSTATSAPSSRAGLQAANARPRRRARTRARRRSSTRGSKSDIAKWAAVVKKAGLEPR